ncbi:hypothetical protein V5799_006455 [Amblyomma americanum]|uniref:Uncharacterized protein n=1 Tax=Amblyomma americanum TaxID=6943 RepID=A0AAQ4DWC6_AMBAM
MNALLAAVLLGLASYAAAGGFTPPSPYAASVYGPAIGSGGYGYGGRGFLPQAYNLQVRFGGGIKAGVAHGGYGHGGYGVALGGYGGYGHGGYGVALGGYGLGHGYGGYGHALRLTDSPEERRHACKLTRKPGQRLRRTDTLCVRHRPMR